jgi:hypothetical protein
MMEINDLRMLIAVGEFSLSVNGRLGRIWVGWVHKINWARHANVDGRNYVIT